MDFFGMGMGEILLIIIVALIIWGPGRLPEVARTIGRTVRAFRKATSDITTAVTKELNMEEKALPPQPGEKSNDKTVEPSNVRSIESDGTKATNPEDERGLSKNG